MTFSDTEIALKEELHRIAPEINLSDIDHSADLREEFDIDSMDFLTLVTVLSKRFDIDIPEADYPHIRSFDAMVTYLFVKTN